MYIEKEIRGYFSWKNLFGQHSWPEKISSGEKEETMKSNEKSLIEELLSVDRDGCQLVSVLFAARQQGLLWVK